jgi:hypothetical protein
MHWTVTTQTNGNVERFNRLPLEEWANSTIIIDPSALPRPSPVSSTVKDSIPGQHS